MIEAALIVFAVIGIAAMIALSMASMACQRIIDRIKDTDAATRLQRQYVSPLQAIHGLYCADQLLWRAIVADRDLPPETHADVRKLRTWWGRSAIALVLAFGVMVGAIVMGFR